MFKFRLKPVWLAFAVVFPLFGTPSAPGTDAVPTVGGDAHAYTCTQEFMDMQAAWDHYLRNSTNYTYGLYLLAMWEFYSCRITTGG